VRPYGTYLIDLTREEGRELFASGLGALYGTTRVAVTQWDGFEKPLLIGARDFGHSAKTVDSGAAFGPPAPDFLHVPFPIATGLGMLQGMQAARAAMGDVAVECSLIAPGLGPWRPDMAPYFDEPNSDKFALGMEWHPKVRSHAPLPRPVPTTRSHDPFPQPVPTPPRPHAPYARSHAPPPRPPPPARW
jgi:hypothetical protein